MKCTYVRHQKQEKKAIELPKYPIAQRGGKKSLFQIQKNFKNLLIKIARQSN